MIDTQSSLYKEELFLMKNEEYRERIYNHYVMAREKPLAPDNLAGLKPQAPYLRRLIDRYFPKDPKASILDLGCGYGAILYFAHQAGYTNIRGIDNSPEQIQASVNLGIEGVEEGNLIDMLSKLCDSSQDCIITFDVIEHFTKEELIPFVDNIFRVLKPEGHWIIHTSNGGSPFFGWKHFGDFTHEVVFTRISLAQLLISSGFKTLQCYEDEPIPHGIKSAIRWFLWKVIRSILRIYIAIETGNTGKGAIFSQVFLAVASK